MPKRSISDLFKAGRPCPQCKRGRLKQENKSGRERLLCTKCDFDAVFITVKMRSSADVDRFSRRLDRANKRTSKSRLHFGGPLNPTNPRSVAIYEFLGDLRKSEEAARKVRIWAY